MPFRRPGRPVRLGRVDEVAPRGRLVVAVALLVAAAALGCRSAPRPGSGPGTWYVVRAGDNLWRLSQRYGVSVDAIRESNRVRDVRNLQIGQRLWIPGADPEAAAAVSAPAPDPPGTRVASSAPPYTLERRWGAACEDAARDHGLAFEWPVLGRVTSAYGAARGGRSHDGIDIAAARGTPVLAAEAGKVVYAGDGLGAYGRVIVLKHLGSWATVYAHNERNLVQEGDFVERGDVIARVGSTGNASAPHLHFEIRHSNRARDPRACLP